MEISIKRISTFSSLGFLIVFALACASSGCAVRDGETCTLWSGCDDDAPDEEDDGIVDTFDPDFPDVVMVPPTETVVAIESVALPTDILVNGQNVIARWSLTNPSDNVSGGDIEVLRITFFIESEGLNLSGLKLYEVGVGQVVAANYAIGICQTVNCSVDLNFVQEILIPGDVHHYELRADIDAPNAAVVTTTLLGHNGFIWSDGPGDTGNLRSGDDAIGFGNDGLVESQTITRP